MTNTSSFECEEEQIRVDYYVQARVRQGDTNLLVARRSDDATSSAAMDKNSRMLSREAPCPERDVIVNNIQSGHFDGEPGTSLRASEEIYCIHRRLSENKSLTCNRKNIQQQRAF